MTKITSIIIATVATLIVAVPAVATTVEPIYITSMNYDGPSSFPGITPDGLAAGTVPAVPACNPGDTACHKNPFPYGGVTNLTINPSGTNAAFAAPIFGLVNGDPWTTTHQFTVDNLSTATVTHFFSSDGGDLQIVDFINWAASLPGNSGVGTAADPMNWVSLPYEAYAFSGFNGVGEAPPFSFTPAGDDPFGAFDFVNFGNFPMDSSIPCSTCTSGIFDVYTISGGTYVDQPIGLGTVLSLDPGVLYTIDMSGSCSNCSPAGNFYIEIIPVPAAVWLFGSALLGLLGWKRKGAAC